MFGWGSGRAVALRGIGVLVLAVGPALAPAAVSAASGGTGSPPHVSTATTPPAQPGQAKGVTVHTPVARGKTPAAVTVSPAATPAVAAGTSAAAPATEQPLSPRMTVRVHGVDASPATALSVEATGPGGAVQAARNTDAGLSARSWSVREAGAAVVALGTLPLAGALAAARRPRRRFA